MLFDLRGRRRRAVQATYLTLAVLMGGGLVLFGIGGDVSGGLFDAFSERSGNADDTLEKRIERNEERLASSPRQPRVLAELVRDEFQLASSQIQSGSAEFPEEARDELRSASSYWRRYLEAQDSPDPSLARVALQIYSPGALDQPEPAQRAAAIIAERENDSASYLQLVSYAALAGDTRTADLATQRALDLAPKGQRKAVERQAEQLKKAPQQQLQGG